MKEKILASSAHSRHCIVTSYPPIVEDSLQDNSFHFPGVSVDNNLLLGLVKPASLCVYSLTSTVSIRAVYCRGDPILLSCDTSEFPFNPKLFLLSVLV